MRRSVAGLASDVDRLHAHAKGLLHQYHFPAVDAPVLSEQDLQELQAQHQTRLAEFFTKHCRKVVQGLIEKPFGHIFSAPVDTQRFQTYRDIVQHPMDLGTIRQQLDDLVYGGLDDFVADVHLVFDNARLFNPVGSDVYCMANMLEADFNKSMADSLVKAACVVEWSRLKDEEARKADVFVKNMQARKSAAEHALGHVQKKAQFLLFAIAESIDACAAVCMQHSLDSEARQKQLEDIEALRPEAREVVWKVLASACPQVEDPLSPEGLAQVPAPTQLALVSLVRHLTATEQHQHTAAPEPDAPDACAAADPLIVRQASSVSAARCASTSSVTDPHTFPPDAPSASQTAAAAAAPAPPGPDARSGGHAAHAQGQPQPDAGAAVRAQQPGADGVALLGSASPGAVDPEAPKSPADGKATAGAQRLAITPNAGQLTVRTGRIGTAARRSLGAPEDGGPGDTHHTDPGGDAAAAIDAWSLSHALQELGVSWPPLPGSAGCLQPQLDVRGLRTALARAFVATRSVSDRHGVFITAPSDPDAPAPLLCSANRGMLLKFMESHPAEFGGGARELQRAWSTPAAGAGGARGSLGAVGVGAPGGRTASLPLKESSEERLQNVRQVAIQCLAVPEAPERLGSGAAGVADGAPGSRAGGEGSERQGFGAVGEEPGLRGTAQAAQLKSVDWMLASLMLPVPLADTWNPGAGGGARDDRWQGEKWHAAQSHEAVEAASQATGSGEGQHEAEQEAADAPVAGQADAPQAGTAHADADAEQVDAALADALHADAMHADEALAVAARADTALADEVQTPVNDILESVEAIAPTEAATEAEPAADAAERAEQGGSAAAASAEQKAAAQEKAEASAKDEKKGKGRGPARGRKRKTRVSEGASEAKQCLPKRLTRQNSNMAS